MASSSISLPAPSTPSFQASELLINFILTEILSLPLEKYEFMLESKVVSLLRHRKLESLHRNVKLAIAILIVGSQRTDYFTTAFKMMSAWSFLDGPHWIIQEELLRHSVLAQFDLILEGEHTRCLLDVGSIDSQDAEDREEEKKECSFNDDVKNRLLSAVEVCASDDLPSCAHHSVVIKRIPTLKRDLQGLIVDLQASPTPKIFMYEYHQRHKLDAFCAWFVKLAKATLEEFYDDLDLSLSRFKFYYIDESNKSTDDKTNFNDDANKRYKRESASVNDQATIKVTASDHQIEDHKLIDGKSDKVNDSYRNDANLVKRDDAASDVNEISDVSSKGFSSQGFVAGSESGSNSGGGSSASKEIAVHELDVEIAAAQIASLRAVRTFKRAPYIQLRKLEEEELSDSSCGKRLTEDYQSKRDSSGGDSVSA